MALHVLVGQRHRASLGDLEQHGVLTPCRAETAFQCHKSWSGIFPFLNSRTDATVAELPRSRYLEIGLAGGHVQQLPMSLSSLLSSPQCHPASRGQQPLSQTNPGAG